MHDGLGLNHLAAKHLTNGLEPQADAEDRQVFRGRLDQVQTDARPIRITRAGADQNAFGIKRQRFGGAHGVIADDARRRPQLLDIVNQVEGEAVIIVDDQQHGRLAHR